MAMLARAPSAVSKNYYIAGRSFINLRKMKVWFVTSTQAKLQVSAQTTPSPQE